MTVYFITWQLSVWLFDALRFWKWSFKHHLIFLNTVYLYMYDRQYFLWWHLCSCQMFMIFINIKLKGNLYGLIDKRMCFWEFKFFFCTQTVVWVSTGKGVLSEGLHRKRPQVDKGRQSIWVAEWKRSRIEKGRYNNISLCACIMFPAVYLVMFLYSTLFICINYWFHCMLINYCYMPIVLYVYIFDIY